MAPRESAIKTATDFVSECRSRGLSFYKVFLFGSYAKENAYEYSDIDLLLISDQFTDNVFENLKLYSKVNIKYPIIETHPYPTRDYLSGNDFIKEVEKESIVIA
ncbi:MAG: nucleotidyltransferase domain-containing protein [Bacteroidetes bacterium]|nr:nucleotidyltransferase domain-containing protein [Bacteroidota bacterium]MCL6098758.1 nucleotidyltransferase domain-containing protein [Bacteroidota bacterium]